MPAPDESSPLPFRNLDRRSVAAVVGLGLLAVVAVWALRPAPTSFEESLPMAEASSPGGSSPEGASSPTEGPTSSESSSVPVAVVAHAAGAVVHPGVYRLRPGARVDDLIVAAGGVTPEADESRVNLAAPLDDGSRVYVPRQGEEVPVAVAPDGAAAPSPSGGAGGDGEAEASAPVDLNTADEAGLDSLPGVGPATAAAIISYREENGPFTSVEELLEVRGIGEAKLEQIRPLVTV